MNTRTVLRFSRRLIWRRALLIPLATVLAACGALGRRESEERTPMTQGAADSQTSTVPAPAAQSTAQESTSTQSQLSTQPKDSTELPATPACDDDDEPTPPQTAGPFYTPNTPLRTSLLKPGIAGTRLLLTGQVLSTSVRPLRARSLISGTPTTRASTTTRATTFAAISLPTTRGASCWRPSCRASIPAARATFTCACRRRTNRFSLPNSTFRQSPATRATASSIPHCS